MQQQQQSLSQQQKGVAATANNDNTKTNLVNAHRATLIPGGLAASIEASPRYQTKLSSWVGPHPLSATSVVTITITTSTNNNNNYGYRSADAGGGTIGVDSTILKAAQETVERSHFGLFRGGARRRRGGGERRTRRREEAAVTTITVAPEEGAHSATTKDADASVVKAAHTLAHPQQVGGARPAKPPSYLESTIFDPQQDLTGLIIVLHVTPPALTPPPPPPASIAGRTTSYARAVALNHGNPKSSHRC